MDPTKIERYQKTLEQIIHFYANHGKSPDGVKSEAIVDHRLGHYEVMMVGWNGDYRVHGSMIHLDLIGDKIWIQYDGTNLPVADELLAAGVPKEDIVLGFHSPEVRQHTEFAVG